MPDPSRVCWLTGTSAIPPRAKGCRRPADAGGASYRCGSLASAAA